MTTLPDSTNGIIASSVVHKKLNHNGPSVTMEHAATIIALDTCIDDHVPTKNITKDGDTNTKKQLDHVEQRTGVRPENNSDPLHHLKAFRKKINTKKSMGKRLWKLGKKQNKNYTQNVHNTSRVSLNTSFVL